MSQRLRAVAELVPQNARVIDVGTDHAMIPVWLVQTNRAEHVWASDLRVGPIQNARRLIEDTDTGDRIQTCLTDGLNGFGPDDGDTVIIAGMGGETMVSILSAAPWTRGDVLLILEPQSKQDLLRRWLLENGYAIHHESLVKDAGRIYPILTAKQGLSEHHTEAELLTGRLETISSDPLFEEYISGIIRRVSAAAPYDEDAEAILTELTAMKESLLNDYSK